MLSKEELQKFETDHKRIAHVVGKDNAWEVVFRKPSRAEYKRFRSMANMPPQLAEAQENLARATVIFPSREAFDALLEDYPGVCEASGAKLLELAGLSVEETVK